MQVELGIHDEGEPLQSGRLVADGGCRHIMPQSSQDCPSELEESQLAADVAACSASANGLVDTAHQAILPQVAKPFIAAPTLHQPSLTVLLTADILIVPVWACFSQSQQ